MRTSRRQFLAASGAMPFALRSMAQPPAPRWVLLGTDKGKGIFRATWNPATGTLGTPELAAAAERPDFFCMNPPWRVLYSVNSVGNGKGAVSSYDVDAVKGTLTQLAKATSHGDGPCALSTDHTGRMLFVANYTAGSFGAYATGRDGHLRDIGHFDCVHDDACGVLGPIHDRQDSAHLHCTTVDPSNRFVLICDLGKDAVDVVGFDASATPPRLLNRTLVPARPGSGPRHLAFHPNGRWLYCIHEVDCTIDLYDWSIEGTLPVVRLREQSVLSTLAPGTPRTGNTACEIVISDNGRFAYACNRGVDDIVVYRIHPKTGLLSEQQRVKCGGQVPRFIAFDPSRRWLASCNQNAPGNVAIFAHDPATGRLNNTPRTFAADTPMFIQWV